MKKTVAVLLILMFCMNIVYAGQESVSYSIQINAAARTLKLFKNNALLKEYPIAVGKTTTRSPLGNFKIQNKVVNPYWRKGNMPPGPKNPLGIRWMGINAPGGGYGIHGNATPSSIGTFASGGCIRMFNSDVEELYSIVGIGTSVQINYETVQVVQDRYTKAQSLIVYPDVYKQKTAKKLLDNILSKNKAITSLQAEKALKVANSSIAHPVIIGEGTALLLNDRYITNDIIFENDQAYIYYLPAIDYLGLDGDIVAELGIPVIEKNGKVYINLTDAANKIGGTMEYDKAHETLYVNASIIKVNGKFLTKYEGDFDKAYMIKSSLVSAFHSDSLAVAASSQQHDLKEVSKQLKWKISADSLNRTMNISIPMKVKVGAQWFETVAYNSRNYITFENAMTITDMQNQAFNVYTYKNQRYLDVSEIMEHYECKTDVYFTSVEVIKLLEVETVETTEITETTETTQQ